MQGEVCAYCEGQAVPGRRHIEHFRPRHRYPQHTFRWDNLFGNCGDTKTCGHRKDAPKARAYAVEDLIKPDEEDPDTFFHFVGDGSIAVREGLAPRQAARARETLRVSGLDEPAGGLAPPSSSGQVPAVGQVALTSQQPIDRDVFVQRFPVNSAGAELALGSLLGGCPHW